MAVAKLLWIMKKSRPDLDMSSSFICMRVMKSDNDNWKIGLERLIHAQNHATIEDLIEIMCDESDPIVPFDTLSILMGSKKDVVKAKDVDD